MPLSDKIIPIHKRTHLFFFSFSPLGFGMLGVCRLSEGKNALGGAGVARGGGSGAGHPQTTRGTGGNSLAGGERGVEIVIFASAPRGLAA